MVLLVVEIIVLSLVFSGLVEIYGYVQLKVSGVTSLKMRNALWTLVLIGFLPIIFLPIWPLLYASIELVENKTNRLVVLFLSYIPIIATGMYVFKTRYYKKLNDRGFFNRRW